VDGRPVPLPGPLLAGERLELGGGGA
jgi:hypothetical protein